MGPNKFPAKIASNWRKPDGVFFIQPEEVQRFFRRFPSEAFWVRKVTETRLKQMGIPRFVTGCCGEPFNAAVCCIGTTQSPNTPEAHTAMYVWHKYWSRKTWNIVGEFIATYTQTGEIVFDPFAGSGVVAIEAARLRPAGTGHCRLEQSTDFFVVGAYPRMQSWDICRQAPDAEASARVASLPFANSDPMVGTSRPLTRLWPEITPENKHVRLHLRILQRQARKATQLLR